MSKKVTGLVILWLTIFISASAIAKMPGADPKDIWEYITKTSPYTQWNFWDDHKGLLEGNQPHGSLHKVFVNDAAYSSKAAPLNYGAIQVKENYNKDKKLMAITVMYKIKGYNPEAGDWFYAKYTPDGMAKPFGKPKGCVGCHGAMAENDYVMVHDFE